MEIGETFEPQSVSDLANWFEHNTGNKSDIWLLIYKKSAGTQTPTFHEITEVAVCYGWVDSIMKKVDAEKYALRFTPRRKTSNWTPKNRAIAQRMIDAGRMTPSGYASLPADMRSVSEVSE